MSTCWLLGGCATVNERWADICENAEQDGIVDGVCEGVEELTENVRIALNKIYDQAGYTFSDLFGDPASEQEAYEKLARTEGCEHAVEYIQKASEKTEVSANYLLALARQESGCRACAQAPTSTAAGMFQFIESTWLVAIHKHGADHGVPQRLLQEVKVVNGRPVMSKPWLRNEVLDMRCDPQLAAYLAAELARENAEYIRRNRDAKMTATDLYMAHFLGAYGARKFLQALDNEPDRYAHELMRSAADANPNVFFERGNRARPRSVAGVYGFFKQKIEVA